MSLNARRERRAGRVPPPAPPDDDQTAWLVTFSDLVLQLFAFVLVATVLGGATRSTGSLPPPPPPAPAAEPPAASPARTVLAPVVPPPAAIVPSVPAAEEGGERLAELGRRVQEVVEAEGRADGVSVRVRDSELVVTLADSISFASASAELLPAARPILRQIGALAAAMPEFDLEVTGHTDDVPIHTGAYPSNLELSLARAACVVHEMTADTPEVAARTVAAGLGEHRPLASNADEAGRAKNRRVEVRLVRAPGPRPAVSASE